MILQGNAIEIMPELQSETFHTCVTSPPYFGLRNYGVSESYWPETTYTPMTGLPALTVPEWNGCLGLESTPEMFIAHLVLVFRHVWRVLKPEGTLWLNLGDSYAGAKTNRSTARRRDKGSVQDRVDPNRIEPSLEQPVPHLKAKDLIGIPWRVALALQADGWHLRMDNIWHKPNCMPESTRDRPTRAHEYLFLLSKSKRYYYDGDAIKEPMTESSLARLAQNVEGQAGSDRANGGAKTNGRMKAVGGSSQSPEQSQVALLRNKRSVWSVPTSQMTETHFATFPEKLIQPCIEASAPLGGFILDPFGGSGTTLKVALEQGREAVIIEMNPAYVDLSKKRTSYIQTQLLM